MSFKMRGKHRWNAIRKVSKDSEQQDLKNIRVAVKEYDSKKRQWVKKTVPASLTLTKQPTKESDRDKKFYSAVMKVWKSYKADAGGKSNSSALLSEGNSP